MRKRGEERRGEERRGGERREAQWLGCFPLVVFGCLTTLRWNASSHCPVLSALLPVQSGLRGQCYGPAGKTATSKINAIIDYIDKQGKNNK